MTEKDKEHTELIGLIEKVLNRSAVTRDVQRLDALLEADSAARSLYLDYADLHASLRRRYLYADIEEADGIELSPTDRESARGSRPDNSIAAVAVRGLAVVLAVAACLLFVLAIQRTGQPGASTGTLAAVPITAEQRASVEGVAVLQHAVDVRWATDSLSYDEGAAIPQGTLAIESGIAQFEFYSGAVAVVEGPAKIELLSAEAAYLHAGKLRAQVPTRARGFTINTDSGVVVDLGTEFALDVGANASGDELHVIEGEVTFAPTGHDADDEPMQINGGEALRLNRDQPANNPLPLKADHFIGPTEIESLLRDKREERYRDWVQWRERLLADPSVMAYYGHSDEPGWSRTFRNFSPNAGDDSHGNVVGCEWKSGRWPGHKALEFRNASHRVSIDLPGEHDSLTLMAWVRLNELHPTNTIALLHPETSQPRFIHWSLDRTPTGATLHFADTAVEAGAVRDRRHYSSVTHGFSDKEIGKWGHCAVVYDGEAGSVRHYRDGKLLMSQPIESPRPVSIGSADIGNWPYRDWAKGTKFATRNLMGRIDEFVVVGRVLADDELAEAYAAGAP